MAFLPAKSPSCKEKDGNLRRWSESKSRSQLGKICFNTPVSFRRDTDSFKNLPAKVLRSSSVKQRMTEYGSVKTVTYLISMG